MTNRNVQTAPTKKQQAIRSERGSRRYSQTLMSSSPVLLIAFAFTVMADPISSVAYAIEAALRALNGNLTLLLPTMALVIAIIAVITIISSSAAFLKVGERLPQQDRHLVRDGPFCLSEHLW